MSREIETDQCNTNPNDMNQYIEGLKQMLFAGTKEVIVTRKNMNVRQKVPLTETESLRILQEIKSIEDHIEKEDNQAKAKD